MTDRQSDALEKLNQGIQESRQEVQRRTMNLAQDYFDGSAEALKQQIQENRDTLEGLPDQIPGGREEAFQAMFQKLMDNYSSMEECINEAQQNVANLDTDRIRREGEVEATDAARRQAEELGVDLAGIEGTGAAGRIIVPDVMEAAERMKAEGGGEEPEASEDGVAGEVTDQAQQQAVQGAQDAAGGAADQTRHVAGQATDQAGRVADRAQGAAGNAADRARDVAGQATDQAQQQVGQAVEGVQGTVGGPAGGGQEDGGPLGGVTDQAGQIVQGAQDAAGQATDQAGQVSSQAQDTVGWAVEQGQQAAEEDEGPKATNAARRKAQQMGVDLSRVQGTGSGGLITLGDVVGA